MLDEAISLKEYLESLPPAAQSAAKSELLNIFRANPWVPRLYGAYFVHTGCNPFEIKTMQPRSEIFFDLNLAPVPKGKSKMAENQSVPICTHIKPSGHRCGSPALRGEIFCYFHQRMIRGVRTPPKSRLHPIAILEDAKSIQASLMEIINALVRNTIDYRRAQLILRALHMAAKNSRHAKFDTQAHSMVDEVPKYPAPRERRKRNQPAALQKPLTQQELERLYDEQQWDWDEIRRKIKEGTYYDPRLEGLANAAADLCERKPSESAKLPEATNSLREPPSKQLTGMSSP
jgi:hypothetical protein